MMKRRELDDFARLDELLFQGSSHAEKPKMKATSPSKVFWGGNLVLALQSSYNLWHKHVDHDPPPPHIVGGSECVSVTRENPTWMLRVTSCARGKTEAILVNKKTGTSKYLDVGGKSSGHIGGGGFGGGGGFAVPSSTSKPPSPPVKGPYSIPYQPRLKPISPTAGIEAQLSAEKILKSGPNPQAEKVVERLGLPQVIQTQRISHDTFVFSVPNLPPNAIVKWNFGDGTEAEGPNQVHQYQKEGIFPVTLTITIPPLPTAEQPSSKPAQLTAAQEASELKKLPKQETVVYATVVEVKRPPSTLSGPRIPPFA